MSELRTAPVTITVRLDVERQARIRKLKLDRAAAGGAWPSNQALVLEAIDCLLQKEGPAIITGPAERENDAPTAL